MISKFNILAGNIKWQWKSLSPVWLFVSPLYSPWKSPGQNTGVGSLSILQGNLPNPGIVSGKLFTSWESPLPAKKVLTPSSCWETGIDIYIAGRFLPAEPQGKSKNTGVGNNNKGLLSLLLSKINYLIKFSHWSMLLPYSRD